MVAFPPEMGHIHIPPELDPLHQFFRDTTTESMSTMAEFIGVPTFSDIDVPHRYDDGSDDVDLGDGFHGLGRAVILGKGSVENLKFEWMITDWSTCSQTCGGNGFQMRAAHCMASILSH